jgi:hypothetical protein
MPIYYKGPKPPNPGSEGPPPEAAPPHGPARSSETLEGGPTLKALGLLLAFASAAGVAACITLLYQGMAEIMVTEGGFVATGGPYEIAHPAPDWAWMMPLAILAGMLFGGIGVVASFRGWGMNIALFAWCGLFISLGWNFLRLGIWDKPEGLQDAWGWWLSGIIFWLMGFAPLVMVVRVVREVLQQVLDRQNAAAQRFWATPKVSATTPVYLAAQLLGAAAGIFGGIALFTALT